MLALVITIYILILSSNFVLQKIFPNNQTLYDTLVKSQYNPPNYIFPIIWLLLYLIISYSYAQSYTYSYGSTLFYVWTLHIILNIIWSPIFFHFENPSLSLIVIGSMIGTLAYILYNYYDTKNVVLFWLNIIYLIWLTFAFYLNFYVVVHN